MKILILALVFLVGCGQDEPSFKDKRKGDQNQFLPLIAESPICEQLAQISEVSDHAEKELALLCRDGHLLKLKTLSPNVKLLENLKDSLSHITTGAYMNIRGTKSDAKALSQLYCSDFASYRKKHNPEIFKRLESIRTWNVNSTGCDFEFKGKKVLWYQPRYEGHSEVYDFGDLMITLSHLTRKSSLVSRATSLSIYQVTNDGLDVWNLVSSSADSKGFHNTVRDEMLSNALLSIQSLANNLE